MNQIFTQIQKIEQMWNSLSFPGIILHVFSFTQHTNTCSKPLSSRSLRDVSCAAVSMATHTSKAKKKSMSLRHNMLLKLRVFKCSSPFGIKAFLKMKRWGLYFSVLLYASLIYKPVPLTGKEAEWINSWKKKIKRTNSPHTIIFTTSSSRLCGVTTLLLCSFNCWCCGCCWSASPISRLVCSWALCPLKCIFL